MKSKKDCKHEWIPFVIPAYVEVHKGYSEAVRAEAKKLCKFCGRCERVYDSE